MTDAPSPSSSPVTRLFRFLHLDIKPIDEASSSRFTQEVLERHKREGLILAVKARWIALSIVAVMIVVLNPRPEAIYYEIILALLAFNGWLQLQVGKVGTSGAELALIALDVLLMCFALVVPNPMDQDNWPPALTYSFGGFIYMFIILSAGTLAYSWRTVIAIGHWVALAWLIAAIAIWYFSTPDPVLGEAAASAFGEGTLLFQLLDPNSVKFDIRLQEIVVFLIVAYTLALTVRRFNRLLLENAALERERTNLSRYFSPKVVVELSQNDEPLKEIREHNVAVLFVDIVNFTAYASERSPSDVITTLRRFHSIMEGAVFDNEGTLDKFLGDGLMATFGTPIAGPRDASNALNAVKDMIEKMNAWNVERVAAGEPAIDARFGLHYGPVVLGDIGANQMEFAAIGNTVNVTSRLEEMTRDLNVRLIMSDDVRSEVAAELGDETDALDGLQMHGAVPIRGVSGELNVWSMR